MCDRTRPVAVAPRAGGRSVTPAFVDAAAQAADADAINLWAGTGFRSARTGTVAELVARLMPGSQS